MNPEPQNRSNTPTGKNRPRSRKDEAKTKLFEIDYIGQSTFQVTQNLILACRSVEGFNKYDKFAKLSARGLHHRDRHHFVDHLRQTTNSIHQAKRQGAYDSKALKSSPQLLNTYFRRALANERLGELDKAIQDYNLVISVEPSHHNSYFNRAGLYMTKGKFDSAYKDLCEAIRLDPGNRNYIHSRALLMRRRGHYMTAIQDTIMARAIDLQPEIVKDIKAGREPRINQKLVGIFEKEDDPLITCLRENKNKRDEKDMDAVVDFLQTLKFFEHIGDSEVMREIAGQIELQSFTKGDVIFEEGAPGEHFYMIVDGEVSIVKLAKNSHGDFMELTLVKLYRGHTFGDTALEKKGGVRSAGAKATNACNLLTLHADPYQEIMKEYRDQLQKEVIDVLQQNPVFQTWELPDIRKAASKAAVKHFNANMEIIKAGEKVKHLYIIKRGLLSVLKRIERPSTNTSGLSEFSRPDGVLGKEAPGTWVLEKNWREAIDQEVDADEIDPDQGDTRIGFIAGILGSGQCFGELSILDPTIASPVTVVTSTQVELYCFDSSVLIDLGARFNSKTINGLNDSMNLHNPPTEKMNYYFRSKLNWEQNKLKLLKSISMEREIRKGT
jgi:CRP-like cAMP-binding protein